MRFTAIVVDKIGDLVRKSEPMDFQQHDRVIKYTFPELDGHVWLKAI